MTTIRRYATIVPRPAKTPLMIGFKFIAGRPQ